MNIKYSLLLLAVFLLVGFKGIAQIKALPIAKIDSLMQTEPRPVLILLSTDWCRFCHLQQGQVRKNTQFLAQQGDFYYIEFNAETKKDLVFKGEKYVYKTSGTSSGIHELAVKLGSGTKGISFPTWVLLDKNYQTVFRNEGVLSVAALATMVKGIQELIQTKEL